MHCGHMWAFVTVMAIWQVCEASVAVTHSMDGRTHIIKCELAKDLGRGYRLDGRLKTGKEIKARTIV